MQTPIWQPSPAQIADANLTRFIQEVNTAHQLNLSSYDELHAWSIKHPELFWSVLWDFTDIIGDKSEPALLDTGKMTGARFFPHGRLNFAENLLRRDDNTEAIVFRGEEKARNRFSWRELNAAVSRLQQAMQAAGVESGDRVAALMPNMPETIIGMLASASLGAAWSSCSPDFGEQGIVDRFGQIEPKILIACDGYFYNGKTFDILAKLAAVAGRLSSLEKILVVPYVASVQKQDMDITGIDRAVAFDDFIAP